MAGAQDATTAALVGFLASMVTLLISKWWDSGAQDRRTLSENRRADDREKARGLAECQALNDELRARCSDVYADNTALRTILLSRGIVIPPPNHEPIP
jgi:hypothetical protein